MQSDQIQSLVNLMDGLAKLRVDKELGRDETQSNNNALRLLSKVEESFGGHANLHLPWDL